MISYRPELRGDDYRANLPVDGGDSCTCLDRVVDVRGGVCLPFIDTALQICICRNLVANTNWRLAGFDILISFMAVKRNIARNGDVALVVV